MSQGTGRCGSSREFEGVVMGVVMGVVIGPRGVLNSVMNH